MTEQVFIVGGEVEPPFFIGRDEEIKKIKLDILSSAQNNIIIGPRRMGKTSLLRNLKKIVKDHIVFAIINCREITSLTDFFKITTRYLITAYEDKHKKKGIYQRFSQVFKGKITSAYSSIAEIRGSVEYVGGIYLKFRDDEINELELITATFEFIEQFANEKNEHILIAFDEFQELNRFNGNIFNVMKSRMDSIPDVRYIFSGSSISLLHDVFLKPDSPLYLMAAKWQLNPIKEKYVKKFIKNRLELQDIQITDQALTSINKLTGGFPFYFQKLGFILYQNAILEKKINIDNKDVEIAFCAMLDEFDSEFEARYIDKFSEQQKKILKILSKEKYRRLSHIARDIETPSSSLSTSMRDLNNSMTIEKLKEGWYGITDNVFRIWLKKNILQ